jgi:hypothetical protein
MYVHTCTYNRGYINRRTGQRAHAESETDSQTDGGPTKKLRGRGHIELSKKGIPHGILHFPMQLQLAGHIYMHDTCAPEASHRLNIRTAMNRVRKATQSETSKSLIDWGFRTRTWAKVIDAVEIHDTPVTRRRPVAPYREVQLYAGNLIADFSCLRNGGANLICNDARISFIELGALLSDCTGWDINTVMDDCRVELYCSARVRHVSGETRTYWATESRYQYNGGCRRDMVEIDLGRGNIGVGQITSFIRVSDVRHTRTRKLVVIRWMGKSSLSTLRDDHDRPLCDFPLSFNHCLWEWSDAGRDRDSFRVHSFRSTIVRDKLWGHVRRNDRQHVIDSEIRARYDIISFSSIIRHTNIHEDPSTGHMLQTLQIV